MKTATLLRDFESSLEANVASMYACTLKGRDGSMMYYKSFIADKYPNTLLIILIALHWRFTLVHRKLLD